MQRQFARRASFLTSSKLVASGFELYRTDTVSLWGHRAHRTQVPPPLLPPSFPSTTSSSTPYSASSCQMYGPSVANKHSIQHQSWGQRTMSTVTEVQGSKVSSPETHLPEKKKHTQPETTPIEEKSDTGTGRNSTTDEGEPKPRKRPFLRYFAYFLALLSASGGLGYQYIKSQDDLNGFKRSLIFWERAFPVYLIYHLHQLKFNMHLWAKRVLRGGVLASSLTNKVSSTDEAGSPRSLGSSGPPKGAVGAVSEDPLLSISEEVTAAFRTISTAAEKIANEPEGTIDYTVDALLDMGVRARHILRKTRDVFQSEAAHSAFASANKVTFGLLGKTVDVVNTYAVQPARKTVAKALLIDDIADVEDPKRASEIHFAPLHARYGDEMLDIILTLRGYYIKLGQMGACTQGFLPDDWMAKLENLQDRVPYESFEYVRGVIEAGLNERIHGEMSGLSVAQRNEELSDAEWISIDDVFEFIDPVPLGSASIGQTHLAKLKKVRKIRDKNGRVITVTDTGKGTLLLPDGTTCQIETRRPSLRGGKVRLSNGEVVENDGMFVVIKIQYSNVERTFLGDMYTIKTFCRLAQPEQLPFLAELEKQFMSEFDYRLEAENLNTVAFNMSRASFANRVVVPMADMTLCSKQMLVMDYLNAKKVPEALQAAFEAILDRKLTRKEMLELQNIYKDQNVITQLAWMTYIMNLKGRTLNALKVVYNYTLGPIFGTYQYNPVVQYIDMDSTIDLLLKIHGHQLFVDGCFNGDPHPGNLLLFDDGRIGLIDFGQVKRLNKLKRRSLARMYKALEAEDVDGLTRVYFDMGNVVKYGKRDVIFDLVRLGFDYDNEQTRKGMNILAYFEHLDREEPLLASLDDWVMPSRVSLLLRGIGSALNRTIYTSSVFAKVASEWLQGDGRISEESGLKYINSALDELQPLISAQKLLIAAHEASVHDPLQSTEPNGHTSHDKTSTTPSPALAPTRPPELKMTPAELQMLVASIYDLSILPDQPQPEDILACVADAAKKVVSILRHNNNYNYEYYRTKHPLSDKIMAVVNESMPKSQGEQHVTPTSVPAHTDLNQLLGECLVEFRQYCVEALGTCRPNASTSVGKSETLIPGQAKAELDKRLRAVLSPTSARSEDITNLDCALGVLEHMMEKGTFAEVEKAVESIELGPNS